MSESRKSVANPKTRAPSSRRAGFSRGSLGSTISRRTGASIRREDGARGMVLPFDPLSMVFHHIWYSVDLPQVSRQILDPIRYTATPSCESVNPSALSIKPKLSILWVPTS